MFTQISQQLTLIEANVTFETQPAPTTNASYPIPFAIDTNVEAENEAYLYTPIGFSREGYVYSPVDFSAEEYLYTPISFSAAGYAYSPVHFAAR